MRTRTFALSAAVALAASAALLVGTLAASTPAESVTAPHSPTLVAVQPVQAPTYSVDEYEAQLMETCAWEQASFYTATRTRDDAYATGMDNCRRSLALIGIDAIADKYAAQSY